MTASNTFKLFSRTKYCSLHRGSHYTWLHADCLPCLASLHLLDNGSGFLQFYWNKYCVSEEKNLCQTVKACSHSLNCLLTELLHLGQNLTK